MVKRLIAFMKEKGLSELKDNALSLFYRHCNLEAGSFKIRYIADHPSAGLKCELRNNVKTIHLVDRTPTAAPSVPVTESRRAIAAPPVPLLSQPVHQPSLPSQSPALEPPLFEVVFVDSPPVMTRALERLANETVIALDMEMDNGADICLIQIGAKTGGRRVVFLFDVLECTAIMERENLPRILIDPNVIKVIHDGRQDFQRLCSEYGLEMAGMFDTQVACTTLLKKSSRLQIGLNKMLQLFKVPFRNDAKDDVDHGAWINRPLTETQCSYAAQDVAFLLDAYESMRMTPAIRKAIIDSSMARVPKPEAVAMDEAPRDILAHYPVPTRLFLRFEHNGRAVVDSNAFPPVENLTANAQDQDKKERELLYGVLPQSIQRALERREAGRVMDNATELVVDVGRAPFLRLLMPQSTELGSPSVAMVSTLEQTETQQKDIDDILERVGPDSFSNDNRCGLSGTLHRISRKVNRQGKMIGFTMRIGRMVRGSTSMIADLLASKKSILLIGCPGVGKTTLLREIARVISQGGDSVEIIDTSNEIAGEGDVPHLSIGAARRMMVADRRHQHDVMIEAVQNHMPQCLIIDEIGTKKEARAAADIRHRGIRLIGTAHGTELRQLVENPELNVLLGGVHTVIIGDDEAQRRKVRSKSVQERMGPCAFDCAIELRSLHTWVIHHDLERSVDRLLSHQPDLPLEVRRMTPERFMTVEKTSGFESHPPAMSSAV